MQNGDRMVAVIVSITHHLMCRSEFISEAGMTNKWMLELQPHCSERNLGFITQNRSPCTTQINM